MELSLFFARVFGPYLVIVSFAALMRRKELPTLVDEFFKNRMMTFFSGGIIIILGLSVVASRNIWEISWRGVITFLGWLTVLKGVLRLFALEQSENISRRLIQGYGYTFLLIIFSAIGIWLTFVGFVIK